MRRHEPLLPASVQKRAPQIAPVARAPARPGQASSAQLAARLAALHRASRPALQLRSAGEATATASAERRNETGLPDRLKAGVEALSGLSLDDVRVHYGSPKPAQLHAHAFTKGTEIHVAPGQERHLAHEAWHVVQQKQGRVPATIQYFGVPVNDDSALEREADQFGNLADAWRGSTADSLQRKTAAPTVVQRVAVSPGYTVSLTRDFFANHIRTSKAAALSRSKKRGEPISTIINGNNANVKTTVEGSQLDQWLKPAGEQRYYQSFNLPHWVTTKVGEVYNITNEQTAALRLGAYFKPDAATVTVSHLG